MVGPCALAVRRKAHTADRWEEPPPQKQSEHVERGTHLREASRDLGDGRTRWSLAPVVFSSAVRGEWREDSSDIDFLVELNPNQPLPQQVFGMYHESKCIFRGSIDI